MGLIAGLIGANALAGIGDTVINGVTSYNNFQQQKATQDYNKQIQQEAWKREDNAVTRRAQDLENAGLSKNLASGSSAESSSPISIGTPQSSYQSNMQGKVGQYLDSVKSTESIKQMQQSTDNLKKQNDLLNQQIQAQKLANGQQEFNSLIKEHDWSLLKDTDIMSTDTNLRSVTTILSALQKAGIDVSIPKVKDIVKKANEVNPATIITDSINEQVDKGNAKYPDWVTHPVHSVVDKVKNSKAFKSFSDWVEKTLKKYSK